MVTSAIKVLKRSSSFNAGFVGLVSGWVAFQAQSIISINQIGLAIWGWIISGLIIGYEINTREVNTEVIESTKKGKTSSKSIENQVAPKTLIGMFIGLIVGLLVGLPPLIASSQFKSALESGDAQIIQQAAYIWPLDPIRMGFVGDLMAKNGLQPEGLKIITEAVAKFPNEYGLWALLAGMPNATSEQKTEALGQMKRLDPLNPNLK